MKKEPEKFEHKTMHIVRWLHKIGYKGMNYPRWDCIRYCAKSTLSNWNYWRSQPGYAYRENKRRIASVVIGFQPFSGLTGEWVEWRFGTVFHPSEKYNADPNP